MSKKSLFLKLFLLDNQGQPSHTKLFSVLGYVMLLVLFPYVVVNGMKVETELWMIVLMTLIGNRSLNKWAELKTGGIHQDAQISRKNQ